MSELSMADVHQVIGQLTLETVALQKKLAALTQSVETAPEEIQ